MEEGVDPKEVVEGPALVKALVEAVMVEGNVMVEDVEEENVMVEDADVEEENTEIAEDSGEPDQRRSSVWTS